MDFILGNLKEILLGIGALLTAFFASRAAKKSAENKQLKQIVRQQNDHARRVNAAVAAGGVHNDRQTDPRNRDNAKRN